MRDVELDLDQSDADALTVAQGSYIVLFSAGEDGKEHMVAEPGNMLPIFTGLDMAAAYAAIVPTSSGKGYMPKGPFPLNRLIKALNGTPIHPRQLNTPAMGVPDDLELKLYHRPIPGNLQALHMGPLAKVIRVAKSVGVDLLAEGKGK